MAVVKQVQYELSLKDRLSGALTTANTKAQVLHNTMTGLGGVIAGIGAGIGIAGVTMFIRSMVDAGTKVEDARVGLTTLLKDANEAGRVIENTMQDATKTPFAFEGLLTANKALISAGESADGAREAVLNLGNAIAATGGGDAELQRMVVNLQQIKNTGQATALDIKQFAFAGVNIYKVLEEAGVKLGKGQQATYEQITMALAKAHAEGGIYFNGLENMAGNTSVQISNLGDAMFQLKVKMFNDLKPAITAVVQGLMGFIERMKSGWEWLVKHKEVVKSVVVGLGEMVIAFKVVIPLVQGFGASTSALLGPLGLVLAGIVAVNGALNLMSAAYDDARAAEAAYQSERNDIEIDMMRVGLQEKQKKSGMSMADFVKKEKTELEKEFAGLNASTEKALREGGKVPANFQDLVFKKKAIEGLVGAPKSALPAASKTTPLKTDKTKATGQKVTTINVSIARMIGVENLNTTTIKEGAAAIGRALTNQLTGAVNDFQLIVE